MLTQERVREIKLSGIYSDKLISALEEALKMKIDDKETFVEFLSEKFNDNNQKIVGAIIIIGAILWSGSVY